MIWDPGTPVEFKKDLCQALPHGPRPIYLARAGDTGIVLGPSLPDILVFWRDPNGQMRLLRVALEYLKMCSPLLLLAQEAL